MVNLAVDPVIGLNDRKALYFSLGDICDKSGEWDRAFEFYKIANKLAARASAVGFHRKGHRATIDRIIRVYSEEFFARSSMIRRLRGDWASRTGAIPSEGEELIFIVGMPRSGTTLIEQILASHPDIMAGGERRDIPNLVDRVCDSLKPRQRYPECIKRAYFELIDDAASAHLNFVKHLLDGKSRFVDKLPSNFTQIGFIRFLFPKAKIMHAVRHPLDMCLSCFFQDFTEVDFATNFGDLSSYYADYKRLMDHWRTIPGLDIHDVRYEVLASAPEPTIRSVLRFCGLDWHPDCLAPHLKARSVQTASRWQVKSPIYTGSIGRWVHYRKHIGPLIRDLAAHSGEWPQSSSQFISNS